ncbi:hypothetical protein K3165_08575 [Qipengyuania sp. 1XM1-15A]|uniref:hypothetical protein n=1 Tax=Qipengyuania xiamenensis TaxID=2867237 RepID=UPI001C8827D3|nr:hypothetical protein [Qipengyuania xiamenensis]MBX7532973.1 hypothetical protein [Qipengyuania xiamenensis]
MSPEIYPLIGLVCGLVGGWIWENVIPSGIAAIAIALLAGLIAEASSSFDGLGLLMVVLGTILAGLMSFFGTVTGTRLKEYFERKSE